MYIKRKNLIVLVNKEDPKQLKTNCKPDWGTFFSGDVSKLTYREAEKMGMVHGNSMSLALCHFGYIFQTFPPHYLNEQFVEIWGIPTKGEFKEKFSKKGSELITFLLRATSLDNFKRLASQIQEEIFKEFLEIDDEEADVEEYSIARLESYLYEKIFDFDFVMVSGEHGNYHVVEINLRDPENDMELDALDIAKSIKTEMIENNSGLCEIPRRIANHLNCLRSLELEAADMGVEANLLPMHNQSLKQLSSSANS